MKFSLRISGNFFIIFEADHVLTVFEADHVLTLKNVIGNNISVVTHLLSISFVKLFFSNYDY